MILKIYKTKVNGTKRSQIMVGHFNTSFSVPDKTSRKKKKKKISNNIKKLNNTINRFDLIVIYRTLHPTATIDIFFLSIQGVFNQGGQMLVHKTNYKTLENNKYKELCSLSKVELT